MQLADKQFRMTDLLAKNRTPLFAGVGTGSKSGV